MQSNRKQCIKRVVKSQSFQKPKGLQRAIIQNKEIQQKPGFQKQKSSRKKDPLGIVTPQQISGWQPGRNSPPAGRLPRVRTDVDNTLLQDPSVPLASPAIPSRAPIWPMLSLAGSTNPGEPSCSAPDYGGRTPHQWVMIRYGFSTH